MDSSIWFQLETRVRILIKDLLEPTVRRVSESLKSLESLSNSQQILVYKIEDLESSLSNVEKRLTVIDEFSTKIVEFEGNVHVMESRIRQDREELRSDLLTFAKNQEAFSENLEVLNRQRESMKEDLSVTNNQILSNKFELESKVSQSSQKFKDAVFAFNAKFLNIDSSLDQMSKEIREILNQVASVESTASQAVRNTEENRTRIKKVNGKVDKAQIVLSRELDKVRNIAITNASDILYCRKEIKRLDDIISSDESAICNEINVTDPLYSVFTDLPTLKLLAEYEIQRLEKILPQKYSTFVQETIEKLKKNAKEIIDRPLPIVKKDSKISTTSKKKRRKQRLKSFKKNMASSIAQTFKQTANTRKSSDFKESFANTRKSSEFKESFYKSMEIASPTSPKLKSFDFRPAEVEKVFPNDLKPEKIERKLSIVIHDAIVSSLSRPSNNSSEISESNSESTSDDFIDFTPMIESVKFQLQQEAQAMYSDLFSLFTSTTSSLGTSIVEVKKELELKISVIKAKHEDYSANVEKKITEIELLVQQAVFECNSASAQRKRDHVDYANQFKMVKTGFDEINNGQKEINEKIEGNERLLQNIVEFGKIALVLQAQDETDRESIFLMGSKIGKKNKVVSLDKRCLSCAGQSSAVISAFKIACLAYEPSMVIYQDKKFTRKHLIRVQHKILDNIQKTGPALDLSEELRDPDKSMSTQSQWRPLSVPASRFSTLASPHLRTPDVDNLPFLRKSLNL